MMTDIASLKETLLECVQSGGRILREHFGQQINVRRKGEQSSIVTDADLASEHWIIEHIRARFPQHSIIAEETGHDRRDSELIWVIDPLDGTSNFAAGLPWFGVQIAVLHNCSPILAAMFLPLDDTLYFAEKGQGAWRNGRRVQVTPETDARNILCAFGLDAAADETQTRQQTEWLCRVANGVRNIRATNSLVDFCYTLDGRLGAAVNLNTKIWDIAPLCLLLPEAGGRVTDLRGAEIVFRPDAEPFDRSYTVLGASPALHAQLLALLK